MRRYILPDPYNNNSVFVIDIPENLNREFLNNWGYLFKSFQGFGVVEWGIVIASAINAIVSWLSSRGGGTVRRVESGWWDFVNYLISLGYVYENPKFIFCSHCDGDTKKIWIDNSGNLQIEGGKPPGDINTRPNSRFDCRMMKNKIQDVWCTLLKKFPCSGEQCVEGNGTIQPDPTGKSQFWDKLMEFMERYGIQLGIGLIIILVVSRMGKK